VPPWIRRWAPPILWAALIWFFSTRYFSADQTSSWIVPILHKIAPSLSREALAAAHYAIRKAAHFTEYFILGLLLLRALRSEERRWRLQWALIALAIAACYASVDEIHQAFVATRTPSARDSLIDISGAFAAQVLAWIRMPKGNRKNEGPLQIRSGP
jgi:VanZ family protein